MKQKKNNLIKLALLLEGSDDSSVAHLKDVVKDVEFNMNVYSDSCFNETTVCGSTGCAVGWFSFIEPKLPKETWNRFYEKHLAVNTDLLGDQFRFLFNSTWPSDRLQTAKRIRYFIEHGIPDAYDWSSTY